MSTSIALRAGDRVLVTRLNYLGDVVLSLPMVDALRHAHPGIEIDYLTREPAATLLRGDTRFAHVIPLRDGLVHAAKTIAFLRRRRYAAVIDLYSNPRSAWLSWLSGAPVRIGGNRRGRRHLYTHPVTVPPGTAVTDVFLHYGLTLGAHGPAEKPRLPVASGEAQAAEERLAAAGVPASGAARIGVHAGGKWPVKRWPAGHFAELIGRIEAAGARVVLLTGPAERDATAAVMDAGAKPHAVLDPLDVRTTAALISRLDGMVVCDGGIMHVSVAVGTPTVGIFGSSQSSVWFPYGAFGPYRPAEIDVPCRPCHQHVCPLGHTRCLRELMPEQVVSLLESILVSTPGSAS